MRVTTHTDVLLEALSRGKSAVAKQSVLPILSCVLLSAKNGVLSIASTDLEVAVIAECKAKIFNSGSIAVSPEALEKILKRVESETITLRSKTTTKRWMQTVIKRNPDTETNEEIEEPRSSTVTTLSLEAGNVSLTLEAAPSKDFPRLPRRPDGKAFVLRSLDKALSQVLYATATENETMISLTGVCFHQDGKSIKAVATDRYRLAATTIKSSDEMKEPAIVPRAACVLIQKLLPGNVKVAYTGYKGNKQMAFHQGNGLVIFSRLIQAKYPEWKELVPPRRGKTFKVQSREFGKAIDTILSIKPDYNRVEMVSRRNKVTLLAKNEGTEIKVDVPARGKVKAAFNINYMKELLRIAGMEEFSMRMNDAHSPGVVTQNGTIHMIMPVG